MGSLSYLVTQSRTPLPESPPELASPTATSFSSRSSPAAETVWPSRTLASLPMSASYEKAAHLNDMAARLSDTDTRKAGLAAATTTSKRPQLPSLSSLFGPPSSIRPLNTPSVSQQNSISARSPLDRSWASPADLGRGSYFPRIPTPPGPHSRTSSDAKSVAEPFLPYQKPVGLQSPVVKDGHRYRKEHRLELEATRWASRHESPPKEHMMSPRAAYQSPTPKDNFRPQMFEPSLENSRSTHSTTRPAEQDSALQDSAVTVSEGAPSKDQLGPKIWTGTHFLPRFVRAAEVPGEGLCYFYDDGSHCKTVIDGEVVNAHWGVTKAGKPRKRLAIACMTCREKKIKCDPDYPRCLQCEKFGRICKFKNAPRGGHNTSPSTPPAELDESRRVGPRSSEYIRPGSDSESPVFQDPRLYQSTPESSHKRLKIEAESYSLHGHRSSNPTEPMDHSKSPLSTPRSLADGLQIPEEVLRRAWMTDPSCSDPRSIDAAISQFFVHVDSAMILRFLPEHAWKTWVSNSANRKAPQDLMLLYSILSLGVTLSGGSKQIASEYAQVAHYAQKSLDFNCLQLVQSRILLAAYNISVAKIHEAHQLMAAAAATAACLQLDQELDRSQDAKMSTFPYGMTRAGYSESRRRTLWSLFMLERLGGMFPNRPAMINPEDLYLRLPVDSQTFEQQRERMMPYFDPYETSAFKSADVTTDVLAALVEIVHIWAECQSTVYRAASRPASTHHDEPKLHAVAQKAYKWHSRLPPRLVFNTANLDSAIYSGNTASLIAMNALFQHAMIKVNRHRHTAYEVSSGSHMGRVQQCREHSWNILDMIRMFERMRKERPVSFSTIPHIVSTAAVEAVDVLTASGSLVALSDLIGSVEATREAMKTMTRVWDNSRTADFAIDQRMAYLERIRNNGSRPTSPIDGYRILGRSEDGKGHASPRWQVLTPIEKLFPKEMDIVYV